MRRWRLSGVIVVDKDVIANAFVKANIDYWEICRAIILDGFNGVYTPVVTNQILFELLEDLTMKYKLSDVHIETIINGILLSEHWMKINYNAKTVERAREIYMNYGVSAKSALLIATMEEHNIKKIITGRRDMIIYPYVETVNPFDKQD